MRGTQKEVVKAPQAKEMPSKASQQQQVASKKPPQKADSEESEEDEEVAQVQQKQQVQKPKVVTKQESEDDDEEGQIYSNPVSALGGEDKKAQSTLKQAPKPTEDLQTIINQQKQLLEEKTKDVGRLTTKLVTLDQTITEMKEQAEKYVKQISDIKGRYEEEISDLKERTAQHENTIVDKNVLIAKAQEDSANANQRLKQETD